jgi:hypothetical protein
MTTAPSPSTLRPARRGRVLVVGTATTRTSEHA